VIVTRGIGRSALGASGIIAAAGLGLVIVPVMGGGPGSGGAWRSSDTIQYQQVRKLLDDRDLLEVVPIIVEVFNGRR
jgi:hypothetical protein